MPATWQQTRDARDRAEAVSHAWERLARAAVAMGRELAASAEATERTTLRYDLALRTLKRLGVRTEGL